MRLYVFQNNCDRRAGGRRVGELELDRWRMFVRVRRGNTQRVWTKLSPCNITNRKISHTSLLKTHAIYKADGADGGSVCLGVIEIASWGRGRQILNTTN